jgi:tetrahydromethanopterin S-methyltransferase subunit E
MVFNLLSAKLFGAKQSSNPVWYSWKPETNIFSNCSYFCHSRYNPALFMFMRGLGEIIIQNTRFKSFADVTNEYIGPFAGYRAVIQFGIVGNQKLTYLATAVTSAIPVIIQHNQYVHPVRLDLLFY